MEGGRLRKCGNLIHEMKPQSSSIKLHCYTGWVGYGGIWRRCYKGYLDHLSPSTQEVGPQRPAPPHLHTCDQAAPPPSFAQQRRHRLSCLPSNSIPLPLAASWLYIPRVLTDSRPPAAKHSAPYASAMPICVHAAVVISITSPLPLQFHSEKKSQEALLCVAPFHHFLLPKV